MSQTEDPAATVARLLQTNLRVVKDSGALASVEVTGEWQNNDAFKGGDGQVTVGLAETLDQKIDLTGKIRRQTSTLRVNIWVPDNPQADENSKAMRTKIADQVSRVIRQNRSTPNVTVYGFVGSGPQGQGCRAFSGDSEAAPDSGWAELSADEYSKLWYSEDSRCQVTKADAGNSAVLLFGFQIASRQATVQRAVLNFEGYGMAPGGTGVTVKVYNHTAAAWQDAQTNTAGSQDEILTLTLGAGLTDFIDSDGYLWFLARTAHTSDGASPAVLTCDYVCCIVTVNGITYVDVLGSRVLDRVDLKPAIYRTEFTVKSWLIENIGV